MSLLELNGVSKSYGQAPARTDVLADINLSVKEGEFLVIVGFSGSGKTTLISLIAGLVAADSGSLLFDGKPIVGAGPDRGVIFQNYSLLPWLSVYDNVFLAVNAVFPDWPKAKKAAHTLKYIEMVNLSPAVAKKPHELSGGMRQRVSVARALAMNPRLLLLDEPLGALDALTRGTLQKEIERIIATEGRTAIMITNDVDEAIVLADRILPLKPGPRATLGPEFKVSLPRPRNVAELNHDPEFKRIRNELVVYLTHCREESKAQAKQSTSTIKTRLPNLKPVDLTDASLPRKPTAV